MKITEKGVYPGIPESVYHADPVEAGSISSTEAKLILDCPAVLKWRRDHPAKPRPAFDVGSAVHAKVLGTGPDVAVIDRASSRARRAEKLIATARRAGKIPVAPAVYDQIRACAEAVLSCPQTAGVFAHGTPEQSIFCQDPVTGVWMRGRIDWTTTTDRGRTVLVDLKTAPSARPEAFARHAARLDYAVQREWYRMIWAEATGETNVDFLHVVVSTSEPILVSVIEMDEDYAAIGRSKTRRALDRYAHCLETGQWPGYAPTVHRIGPPAHYAAQEMAHAPNPRIRRPAGGNPLAVTIPPSPDRPSTSDRPCTECSGPAPTS